MNKRGKKLMIDVVMFALSNFGSKVLVFLMVPLYTHVLTTEEFAIADLMTGTINILFPVLTLAISEATLRFLLEENSDKGKILGASLLFIGISTMVIAIATPFAKYINEEIAAYWGYFLALYLATSLNSCMSNYVRGIDKTKLFATKGVLQTLLLVSLNLLLLLGFEMGLRGYLFAIILSDVIVLLYMMIGCRIWTVLSNIRLDKNVVQQMLKYSVPMMPTIIAWWIMQISDKYILIAYCGLAISGIYSVSYRIPSVLSIVSSIFNQAWQISAVKAQSDEDYSQYVIKVYQYFFMISLGLCSLLIGASKLIGKFMFLGDFNIAWTYVPVLLVAYFYSGISGVMASIFTTKKRTAALMYSTLCAAVTNIVLNFLLIPQFGAMAAATTTAIAFLMTFLIRSYCTKKFFCIKLNGSREKIMSLLIIVQAIVMSTDIVWKHLVNAVSISIIILSYSKEIFAFIKQIKDMVKNKISNKKQKENHPL